MTNIYVLKDPTTNEIRYVGKTKQKLNKRLWAHLNDYKRYKSHKINWIKSLTINNLKPIIELIEYIDDSIWEEREIYWIKYYKDLGYNLTNMTDGGTAYEEINRLSVYNTSKKVNQFDLSGNLVKTWPSIKEASRSLNILSSHICDNVINSIKTYKNYIWSYNNQINIEDYFWNSRKIILELDKNNNLIRQWNSIIEAATFYKVKAPNISRVLRKERKSFRKHKWIYKNKI